MNRLPKSLIVFGMLFCVHVAFARDNPKLRPEITEAHAVGLKQSTLRLFLSQADGAKFAIDTTTDILKNAIETQKMDAPGDQVLLKAIEGVAKGATPTRINNTTRKLAEEWQQIAKSIPATLPAHARKRAILEKYREAHPTRPTAVK